MEVFGRPISSSRSPTILTIFSRRQREFLAWENCVDNSHIYSTCWQESCYCRKWCYCNKSFCFKV